MTQHERGLEFKVGAFVFVGLAMLAALVVQFGRLGEGFKNYYVLTVQFADASGLLKGSDVLLAGAKIGHVSGGPHLVKEGHGVLVPIRIYDYVKIPVGSKFAVGSSGLLGDRFVSVTMPPGEPKEFIQKNATIEGYRETGLDDLTKAGGDVLKDLQTTVQNINSAVVRLNEQGLSPQNLENWKATFQHLNDASANLAESSKKIDGVIEKADGTMESIRKDADDLQGVVAESKKTVQAATDMFHQATEGKGLLGNLLTNKALASDFQALITNLRAHGVLFYRDSAAKSEMKKPQDTRQRPTEGR